MADVQLGHGHLRIANALYEAINAAPFTDSQRRIVHALVRMTYGWQQRSVEASVSELARAASQVLHGRASGGFRAALSELTKHRVVEQLRVGDRAQKSIWAVQKDFEQWGAYSVPAAMLEDLWGKRPASGDALLNISRDEDRGGEKHVNDQRNDNCHEPEEGASPEAPSTIGDGASTEAASGQPASGKAVSNPAASGEATAPTEAISPTDVASPKTNDGLRGGHMEGANSCIGETCERGNTGKTVELQQPHNNSRVRANDVASGEAAPLSPEQVDAILDDGFDPTALLRWDELSRLLATDHNRDHVCTFLANCPAEERSGFCGRFANWLQGVDCPPTFAPRPEVLATALSEYKGDYTARHVWAFVEDCVRRWQRGESAGSGKAGYSWAFGQRGGDPRNPPGAPDGTVERARLLYAMAKEFSLLTFESESGYTARMEAAAKDDRCLGAAAFIDDMTRVRIWEGIGSIRQERFAIEEIARRLVDKNWRQAS